MPRAFRHWRFHGLSLLLIAFATTASPQTDTATITGVITDSSSAAVPGVNVEATNQATGLKYRSETNEAGVYVVTALPIGLYDLSVRRQGFQAVHRSGIRLSANDRARIDLQLQVGTVTEVLEVTSQAPLLQSETSNLSQVIENSTITNMPLNGRNYQQLAMLSPGVLPQRDTNFVTDAFSVNGANMLQNQFVMDGADNTNYLYGVVIASNQVIKPSIDAIQEFKMETHNLSAEFGRGGGGVVQVTTKSGTNRFHGTAFEFLRNDKLDANNFFNSGRPKPPYRQNQYGGTFGGPIKRDKSFFFASFQGTKIREKLTRLNAIPTPAMIRGEFPGNIFDPATQDAAGNRQPFAGNRIAAGRIDPVAVKVLELYPAPNRTDVQNYLFNASRNDDDSQVDSRLDHRFRDQDSIFVRYGYHDRARLEPGNLPMPASGGNTAVRLAWAHSLILNHTHVFKDANKVNELRASYTKNNGKIDTPNQERLWEKFGFKGLFDRPDITGLPLFNLTGFTSIGDRNYAPDPKHVDVKQVVDNLSWNKGRHAIRTGVNLRWFVRYAGTTDFARGTFTFNGQFSSQVAGRGTASAMADALLGLTSNATLSTPLDHTLRALASEAYFQDNFKLSQKLTLNLGFRYEYQPPFVEDQTKFATFVFLPGLAGYGTIVQAKKDGSLFERSFQRRDWNNFAPRLGLAYQLTAATVIRAGYAIFYDTTAQTNFNAEAPINNPPYYMRTDVPTSNQSSTSNLVIRNGFAGNALNPDLLSGRSLYFAWPYDMPDAMTHQWNFNIQRALPGRAIASAAYVGSNTIHRRANPDLNQPYPGPGALNPRRAFPDLASVTTSVPVGGANYQGLELKFERQFSRGISTLNGYTWSHTVTSGIGQNTREMVRDKGLSSEDLRHRFFSTAVWELPFGPGKKWAASGAASQILGHWQLSTLLNVQTGLLFSPGMSTNTVNTTGGGRPDRIGEGNLPRGQRSPDRWFDKTAFVAPRPYVFGNSGFNILQGPGAVNLDSTIARIFRLTERVRLDFRTEVFNLFNEGHFGLPNALIDNPVGGRISATSSSARQIQFGMKLVF